MKKIVLQIEGMTCSACSLGLEKYLKRQKGIIEVNVNLILSIATIEYDGVRVSDLNRYIKEAGFVSKGEFRGIDYKEDDHRKRNILIIMGMILIIVMAMMIFQMFFFQSGINYDKVLWYAVSLVLVTLVFIGYGMDIIRSGIKNGIHGMPNMDTLVCFSVVASFLYSVYELFHVLNGNYDRVHYLYFESTMMVIYFVKLGRFIENKSRDKTKEAISKLVQITPRSAMLKIGEVEKEVSIDEVEKDDILVCRVGEKVAVDGVVVEGKTYVDESFITGESEPVLKKVGDKVIAGSINYNGVISYQAKRIGRESTISSIVQMVVEATNTKNKTQKLVDRISSYFVPSIIIIAIFVFLIQIFLGIEFQTAFLHFVTILVVACPCALGLAVPLVMVVANGVCASYGLFVRNSEVLENARKIDKIIFDKTGTLTYGKLKIFMLYNYSAYQADELLNRVANIEKLSSHPIATAFQVEKDLEVTNYEEMTGFGICAEIGFEKYYLGNQRLVSKLGMKDLYKDDYEELVNSFCSVIYVIENDRVIGLVGVKDIIRDDVKNTFMEFSKLGIETMMLTGDNEKVAFAVGEGIGIDEIKAEMVPDEKADIVKKLVCDGRKVIMVGDGINDAPALVNATIGIGINDGTDVAMDAADVILMNNNLHNILDLIQIGKYAYKIIKENLFWAFFYNICMIPIAAGLLEKIGIRLMPVFGSIAMVISSLTVIFNTLKLNKLRRKSS